MNKKEKEYFFLIYFDKPKEKEESDEVKFNEKEKVPKCIFTKIIQLNEENDKLIKIFKYIGDIKSTEKVEFKFSYDNKNFEITIENQKNKTFIFDIILKKKSILSYSTISQKEVEIHDKMNYFIESLKRIKEDDKLEILFSESIILYSKKPSFQFLIIVLVVI